MTRSTLKATSIMLSALPTYLAQPRLPSLLPKRPRRPEQSLRSTTRQRMDNRATLVSEVAGLEAEITHLRQRGAELERVRDAAAAQRSLVERHLALADQLERYEQQRSRLIEPRSRICSVGQSPLTARSRSAPNCVTELENSELAIAEMTEGTVAARSVITAADQSVRSARRRRRGLPDLHAPTSSP